MLDTNSGDEAVHVVTAILDAFAVQGQACGVVAQDNLEEHTAPAIYNALQNFYVNGMPCMVVTKWFLKPRRVYLGWRPQITSRLLAYSGR